MTNDKNFILDILDGIGKFIFPIPRKVYYSKYLLNKIEYKFNRELIEKIKYFENKFKNGENINSNCSKNIFRLGYIDHILNAWNLRHLHLSRITDFNSKCMTKNRSKYLLFFILTRTDVYFIDVREHPQKEGFTSFEFLEIMEESNLLNLANFIEIKEEISNPNIVVEKKFYEYKGNKINVDKIIYELMLKRNLNLFYKINGRYYLNNAIVSTGHKVNTVFEIINLNRELRIK